MTGCKYCDKGPEMDAVGLEVCALSVSTVYMFREQSYPGRLIIACDEHVADIIDLPEDKRAAFLDDVAKAAKALRKAFNPGKINYGAFGDTVPHLHFHLVPKYEGGPDWGGMFQMNPGKKNCTDAELAPVMEKFKAAL